jgi:hypothetical protein
LKPFDSSQCDLLLILPGIDHSLFSGVIWTGLPLRNDSTAAKLA